MTGSAAPDSNAYVALCAGDAEVATLLGALPEVLLPVVVLGELLYGAAHSGRPDSNRERVLAFAAECRLLEVTPAVAERYAELKLALRHEGRPIPENDLWIAATCLMAGVPLITRDRHFDPVPGLEVVSW